MNSDFIVFLVLSLVAIATALGMLFSQKSVYPASAVVACGSAAEDAIEQTVTAGGSSFTYDATTDRYTYVWKTDKPWANTCRTFVLRLGDGSYYRANFKFK